MDKQTKLLLGLGLIGVGGYMLWKQGQQKPKASYVGNMGRRMRMSGKKNMAKMAGGTVEAQASKFNASGTFSHGGFFDVSSPNWKGLAGQDGFYDVQSSDWLRK